MAGTMYYPNIYICGKAGVGKSEVAKILVAEYGYRREAMANGVKRGVHVLLNMPNSHEKNVEDYVKDLFPTDEVDCAMAIKKFLKHGNEWRINITGHMNEWRSQQEFHKWRCAKENYRAFMQWWGTAICRTIDENVWVDYYLRHVFTFENPVVCDDVRFHNEEHALSIYEYTGIHITCDTIATPTSLTDTQSTHESEQYEPAYCKYAIHNDGDLEQLKLRVHEVMREMSE